MSDDAARQKANQKAREGLRNSRSQNHVYQCADKVCCEKRWKDIEAEVKKIDAIQDPVERNKQINAAYADLYLKDPAHMKWAGTAAIVSKQVGCTMQNNIVANNEQLGVGNQAIFDNIYPTLKLYQTSVPPLTREQLLKCLNERLANNKDQREALTDAVGKMFDGKNTEAAIAIAMHEQKEIVENAMWKSKAMSTAAWLNGKTGELGADQSVYFVAGCNKPSDRELSFPWSKSLANPDHRVEYYQKSFIPMFDKINNIPNAMTDIMTGIRNTGGTF